LLDKEKTYEGPTPLLDRPDTYSFGKNGSNEPSRSWIRGFLARHPEISKRVCEALPRARTAVTRGHIDATAPNYSKLTQIFENRPCRTLMENIDQGGRMERACQTEYFYPVERGIQVNLTKEDTHSR
jgi:hypothetical protein